MIFVGAQSINSRAILANKKIYTHDFFFFFFLGGGGTCPQAPRSYAPDVITKFSHPHTLGDCVVRRPRPTY